MHSSHNPLLANNFSFLLQSAINHEFLPSERERWLDILRKDPKVNQLQHQFCNVTAQKRQCIEETLRNKVAAIAGKMSCRMPKREKPVSVKITRMVPAF